MSKLFIVLGGKFCQTASAKLAHWSVTTVIEDLKLEFGVVATHMDIARANAIYTDANVIIDGAHLAYKWFLTKPKVETFTAFWKYVVANNLQGCLPPGTVNYSRESAARSVFVEVRDFCIANDLV